MENADLLVFRVYRGRCARCKATIGLTIHEINARSLGNDPMRPDNRSLLCASCHNWAHSVGSNISSPELTQLALIAWNSYAG